MNTPVSIKFVRGNLTLVMWHMDVLPRTGERVVLCGDTYKVGDITWHSSRILQADVSFIRRGHEAIPGLPTPGTSRIPCLCVNGSEPCNDGCPCADPNMKGICNRC